MVQIFFVSGAAKSGTTWLQRILDAHPDVVCSGEGHFVEQIIGPMAKMKAGYNAKQEMDAERVFEGKPYYQPLTDGEVAPLARSLILHIMGKRAAGRKIKALGDKTPRYTRGLDALLALFPAARFINIVRHPFDVAVSVLHHGNRFIGPESLQLGTEAHHTLATNSAGAWSDAQASVRAFRERHPDKLAQVRYEDLQGEGAAEAVCGLFAFLGVNDSPRVAERALQAASFEALSGRPKGEENPKSFFRKGVSDDWRGRLDNEALAVLRARCGELMRLEGYGEDADITAP